MRFWEGHAPHTVSLIALKFDTLVHVLYKKEVVLNFTKFGMHALRTSIN